MIVLDQNIPPNYSPFTAVLTSRYSPIANRCSFARHEPRPPISPVPRPTPLVPFQWASTLLPFSGCLMPNLRYGFPKGA
jgi:hypothetical protein